MATDGSMWILENAITELTLASPAVQITVGAVAGWLVGYIIAKIGRAAALAIGVFLILLQILHQKEYIKINWKKVQSTVNSAREQVERNTNSALPSLAENAQHLLQDHMYLAGGFGGGFLLGLVSA